MPKNTIKCLPGLFSAGIALLMVGLAGQVALAADADIAATATVTGKAQPPIMVTLSQMKVGKDATGAPKMEDAKVVAPGDVLEYRAVYKNQSTAVVSVVATLPVPEALEYLQGSAMARAADNSRIPHTVALKDNRYAAEPLMRKTMGADGASVTHAVPYAEYRSVRWNLEKLAPGASVEVSMRAKVGENQAPMADAAK